MKERIDIRSAPMSLVHQLGSGISAASRESRKNATWSRSSSVPRMSLPISRAVRRDTLIAVGLAHQILVNARQQALDLALQIQQLRAQLLGLVRGKRVSAIERAA